MRRQTEDVNVARSNRSRKT